MNQDRLGSLEKRVEDVENENGWHEWGKHVLKELERLNQGQETMRKDNNDGHKTIYKKLDEQKKADENRLISCNDRFLPVKVFHWLLLALIVALGGMFAVGTTHITSIHDKPTIEQPIEIKKPKLDK